MDYKVTLSFDENVIQRAKKYAADNHISLSRLIEYLLNRATSSGCQSLEDMPVSDWVSEISSEGTAEYQTKRTRQSSKKMSMHYYRKQKRFLFFRDRSVGQHGILDEVHQIVDLRSPPPSK